MASLINADNGVVSGSSGVKTTADTSGVLALQSNGTTGLTLGTDLSVTVVGAGSIQGLTVGRGAGAVASNTVVGASAFTTNTTGATSVSVGAFSLGVNSTGNDNTVVGYGAGYYITGSGNTGVGRSTLSSGNSGASGGANTAVGYYALQANTTASYGTAVGYQAGHSSQTADYNTFVGYRAGYSTTGDQNTFLGKFAGNAVTSGATNTIVGAYNGNQGGLDIRTASNYTVISDGGGTPHLAAYANGTVALQGAVPNAGTGITFPATQSASSNANTLDDYEEGTWTPTIGGTGSNPTGTAGGNNAGHYVKVGKAVHIRANISFTSISGGSGNARISGLPFASSFYWTSITIGYRGGSTSTQPAACMVENASTNMQFWTYSSTSNPQTAVDQSVSVVNMGTNIDWYIEGTYFTS